MTIAIVLVFAWFLAAGSYPIAQRVRQTQIRRGEADEAMVYLLEEIAWVRDGRSAA